MVKDMTKNIRNVQKTVNDLKICQFDPVGVITQEFGFMKFDHNPLTSDTRLSQYIRLSLDTNAETIVRFLKEGWCLPIPDLIISVTGGAKSFDMSTRLRKIFQRGLVAAAVTTNAWLITAGTNAGVVKEVGQALSNYRYKNRKHGLDVTCIGIGSWGYTAGNEQLEHPSLNIPTESNEGKGLRPFRRTHYTQTLQNLRMSIGDQYCVRDYVVKQRPEKRCELEPNHTHFLLLDDGQSKADTVLQLRAEIENGARMLNRDASNEGANEMQIPLVMVLVEGGPSSIKTICQALEINTPVVVVKDSGRAADLVAELHACFLEGENTTMHVSRPQTGHTKSGSRENEINNILNKVRASNSWVDEVKSDLCRVLNERKQLVTIFKFDSKRHNGNLEDAILEALFNATKFAGDHNEQHRRVVELKLAMAWHKFDYAQKHLLNDRTISKWKEDDLHRALVEALRRGHVNFVELLLEFGTPLAKLTEEDLDYLYSKTLAGGRLPIKRHEKDRPRARQDYYADYFRSMFGNNSNILKTRNNKISQIENTTTVIPMINHDNLLSMRNDNRLGMNAARDLFFWAVFLNRFELATYLCSKTWHPSMTPLFGAQIYRRAARLTLDSDRKKQYGDYADKFDFHAMSIIDQCFDNDENFAVDLLKRPLVPFENAKPLQIAQRSNSRSFLASKCVQRYLDNEWFGYINYKRKLINFRIFLCSLFFPLLPLFCVFLPYVQKHKKSDFNTRDRSKNNQSVMNYTDEQTNRNKNLWIDRIQHFYEAPIVRFYYYIIFFVIFLGLYSFVLLVDFFPLNTAYGRRSGYVGLQIPITEIILHICIWSLILEEIRQIIFSDTIREYLSEIWNMIDILAIALYLVGFITRFFVVESVFIISKIFLCLDLILWYIRTLHLFAAYEKLGPKLIMIFNTMKDLLFFICFLIVFLLGFSIASWALLTTTQQVTWTYDSNGMNVTVLNGGSGLWSWQLLRDVTNYGVWKIFGQVDEIEGTDSFAGVSFVLAILFVAIANVLLLNVLVALFNVTIQNVQNQSHRIWRYQRFRLVMEYTAKPPLPPPFNILYYIFAAAQYLILKLHSCRQRHPVGNEPALMSSADNEEENSGVKFQITDAMQRESAIADDYWQHTFQLGKKDLTEVSLQNIERKLHDLKERLQITGNTSNNQVSNFDLQWTTYEK